MAWHRALIIGSLLVSGAAAHAEPAVIAYAPLFKDIEASVGRSDIQRYSHINLAFANPDAEGRIVDGETLTCAPTGDGAALTMDGLRSIVARLQAKGIKVSMSVAGGVIPGCSGDWAALLAPDRRDATVANLVALVDDAGLDGLDVDIEGTLLTAIDQAGDYTPFIAALSKEMKRRGKLLTCATASYEGGMIPVSSIPYFDFVNVMSYDAIGPSWGPAGAEHSTYEGAVRDMALWRTRGVAKERLVLGVPYYGYGFGGETANWSYRDLVERFGNDADNTDLIGKACAGCTYITFNTPDTIRRKAELAAEQGGGVMVWEVSQDTDDGTLLRAIEAGLE